MIRALWLGAAAVLLAVSVTGAAALSRRAPRAHAGPATTALAVVPFQRDLVAIDGALEEPAWRGDVLRSGPFLRDDGAPAAPHTEARLGWSGARLFVALYAADIDVESADRMRVEVGSTSRAVAFEVAPRGGPEPPAGVMIASEADEATVDDPRDRDEEWTAEAAIDLAALGLRGAPGERVTVRMTRCERAAGAERRCTSWRPAGGGVTLGGS